MKNLPKIVVYQYVLKAERTEEGLVWKAGEDAISKLFLGFPWQEVLNSYHKRAKFYYGFSISGHGDELFPIIDAKVEVHKASLSNPEFLIEIASMPTKLTSEHRDRLYEVLDDEILIDENEFKLWWDDDPRGPRKRKLKDKKKLITQVKELVIYTDADDLKLEDAEVSIHEALAYFGFETNLPAKEVRKDFKTKYRQLQLQHHPDTDTGNEEAFLYLQKCHNILKKWIR
jgi:hypothetical protein